MQLSHKNRRLPSGNRLPCLVFVHFVPGHHGSKCWRQIICKHTHTPHTLLSPEVGNFRPLHIHYLPWPLTLDLWPPGWPELFPSAVWLVSLTLFVFQAVLFLESWGERRQERRLRREDGEGDCETKKQRTENEVWKRETDLFLFPSLLHRGERKRIEKNKCIEWKIEYEV